ncbi:uncharacterized protein LOC141729902 isoform X2 [Zonotrichia albicollis]|uniref:uncharacterized protein LOC141729902 isoform X2 n=1 Tax=Zonotrichia albicollis TaxID=44394 RepID=UPI003D80B10D
MFQALSPELALMVTTWGHRDTVAAGVGGALLFLLLLLPGSNKKGLPQIQRPPPEEGKVPYTHGVSSEQAQWPSNVTVPQDPQETYVELWGSHGRPWEPSDIYGNVL